MVSRSVTVGPGDDISCFCGPAGGCCTDGKLGITAYEQDFASLIAAQVLKKLRLSAAVNKSER